MSYFAPISISLSPNTEKDDTRLARRLIFSPWRWKSGNAAKEFEEKFKRYQNSRFAYSFNSGRSAFYAILKALELPTGSEVLIQAFTCNAVPNPILWAGLMPIYVDCEKDDFNISISDLRKKITKKSRVVVVQHTFGLPAEISEIEKIAKEHKLFLIEDCAHSLGAEYGGKKVGTSGQAAFFSFSRDKVISSVYGGMATTNDEKISDSLRSQQSEFGNPSYYWIFQQLLHPVLLNYVILPIYKLLDLGKIFLVLSQWLHILSKAVHWREKRGKKPRYFPKKMPNGLAILALKQFGKLEKFYVRRAELAQFYYKELSGGNFKISQKLSPEFLNKNGLKHSFLRFSIGHKDSHSIIYQAWHKKNILIGDWYTSPVAPDDTQLDKVMYKTGSCPIAEELSKSTLNLPTHINIKNIDARRVAEFLKQF